MKRGDLNSTKDSIVTGTLSFEQNWAFDETGNWNTFKEDSTGGGSWTLDQPRTHNKVNELTVIGATTGPNWIDPVHDRVGNMTTLPQPANPTASYSATWDPWNRLVKLMDGATTIGEYAYDGMTRRTKKVVSGVTHHFYYSRRWQVLEERLGASPSSATADRQFIWGIRYIDDLVCRDRDADGNSATGNLGKTGSGPEERLYSLQDSNWNVIAITNAAGTIQERYGYTAYGETINLTPAFGSRSATQFDWETRYAGYRWDGESGLLVVRYRILHLQLGRWISRDPLRRQKGFANLLEYALSRPLDSIDPLGLERVSVHISEDHFDDINDTTTKKTGAPVHPGYPSLELVVDVDGCDIAFVRSEQHGVLEILTENEITTGAGGFIFGGEVANGASLETTFGFNVAVKKPVLVRCHSLCGKCCVTCSDGSREYHPLYQKELEVEVSPNHVIRRTRTVLGSRSGIKSKLNGFLWVETVRFWTACSCDCEDAYSNACEGKGSVEGVGGVAIRKHLSGKAARVRDKLCGSGNSGDVVGGR